MAMPGSDRRLHRMLAGAAAIWVLCAIMAGPATAKPQPFSGKLCPLFNASQLSSVDIESPCVQTKTSHSRGGTIYNARWGANAGAHNFLLLSVAHFTGPGASIVLKRLRAHILGNGHQFKVKGGELGSAHAETYSGGGPPLTPTPPYSNRKSGEAMCIVGKYLVTIDLNDDNPEASDEAIEMALIPLAQSVAARL
jgi:hypothetical protein